MLLGHESRETSQESEMNEDWGRWGMPGRVGDTRRGGVSLEGWEMPEGIGDPRVVGCLKGG